MARNPVRRPHPAKPVPETKFGPKPVIGTLAGVAVLLAVGISWLAADRGPRDEGARPAPRAVSANLAPAPPAGVVAATPDAPRACLGPAGSGATAYAIGDHEAALAHYHSAIAAKPQDAESHSNLGQMLVRLKRPADALPYFDRAIELLPQRWAYHFNRARTLGLLERWDEAVTGYKLADAIMPDDYATTFNLG
jgi:tetratricopeptide (TPR) repeat protein